MVQCYYVHYILHPPNFNNTASQFYPPPHLPIIITTLTSLTPTPHRITHTNYKIANWPSIMEQTEQFLVFNSTPITNIDTSIAHFNSIITNTDRAHISGGNRKHHNCNFIPEIGCLIRERGRLKCNSTLPLTHDITMHLQYLNNNISDRIYEQKTQNWRSFITTLNHETGTSKLYKTLKSIIQSNRGITTSQAATDASNSIPTYKAQANILIDCYANISHMKPLLCYPIDHTLTHLSPQNTKQVIDIKNSPATGPDSISNFHLKHFGPHGIQALTNNSNYTYAFLIQNIWKQGRIITILKPNKDIITPSYRPITLLCTASKITECLILNIIHPDVPLAPTQHRFQPYIPKTPY